MIPEQVAYISIFTSLFAGYFYIRDTLKGGTKPNRVSWFMWFIAPMIASTIVFQSGSIVSFVPVFMSGFVPFLVFLVSFKNKNAYWKLDKLDYFCLFLSLCALISWIFLKEGLLATIFAILADGIAFFPTYLKSWEAPDTETVGPYISGTFNGLLSLFTAGILGFNIIGFAIYLFFGNLVEIAIILYRRRKISKIS